MRILFSGFNHKRLVTIVYVIQLVFAITIGLQVFNVIDASIGNSYSLEGLKTGNAHMVVNDLLNVHGPSLSPLFGQVRWIVLVYLIISAFINGGIWYSILGPGNRNSFWIGGANYFGRCLKIGIFWTVVFILISALLWIPYLTNISRWMEEWPSEAPILWIGAAVVIVWSIISVFLFVGSSYSKIFLIQKGLSSWKSIIRGVKFSAQRTLKLFPVLLIFAAGLIVLYAFHMWIDDFNIMKTSFGIFVLFIIQQVIVWSKIAIRVGAYKYIASSNSNES